MSARARIARIAVIVMIVTVVGLVTLGACGSSDSGVSDAAGARLLVQVAAIRDSAAAGDRSAAEGWLQELRVEVEKSRSNGELTDSAVTRIVEAADDVEANLPLLDQTTTTTEPPTTDVPTTTETPTTETPTTATTTSAPTTTAATTTTQPVPDEPKGNKKNKKDD